MSITITSRDDSSDDIHFIEIPVGETVIEKQMPGIDYAHPPAVYVKTWSGELVCIVKDRLSELGRVYEQAEFIHNARFFLVNLDAKLIQK